MKEQDQTIRSLPDGRRRITEAKTKFAVHRRLGKKPKELAAIRSMIAIREEIDRLCKEQEQLQKKHSAKFASWETLSSRPKGFLKALTGGAIEIDRLFAELASMQALQQANNAKLKELSSGLCKSQNTVLRAIRANWLTFKLLRRSKLRERCFLTEVIGFTNESDTEELISRLRSVSPSGVLFYQIAESLSQSLQFGKLCSQKGDLEDQRAINKELHAEYERLSEQKEALEARLTELLEDPDTAKAPSEAEERMTLAAAVWLHYRDLVKAQGGKIVKKDVYPIAKDLGFKGTYKEFQSKSSDGLGKPYKEATIRKMKGISFPTETSFLDGR
jgi:hypothetical protein